MAVDQLIGLQHAGARADGEVAIVEGPLQRALGRLPACPGVVLVDEYVVIDVADRERAVVADALDHSSQLVVGHLPKPAPGRLPVAFHRRQKEAQVLRRDVREGVGPVLKNRLIDALGSMQVLAPVVGNSGPQDVVMAPLDHVDRVDLNIAEMSDCCGRRRRAGSEWSWPVEPLGTKPDPPGLSRCEEERRAASSRPKRTFLAGRPSLWHRTRAATRRTTGLHVRARHLRRQ